MNETLRDAIGYLVTISAILLIIVVITVPGYMLWLALDEGDIIGSHPGLIIAISALIGIAGLLFVARLFLMRDRDCMTCGADLLGEEKGFCSDECRNRYEHKIEGFF